MLKDSSNILIKWIISWFWIPYSDKLLLFSIYLLLANINFYYSIGIFSYNSIYYLMFFTVSLGFA